MRELACFLSFCWVAFASAAFADVGASRGQGYILGPRDGQRAMSHLIKVDPDLGSPRLGLGTQILKPGRGIAFHAHELEDEVLYVVRGTGTGFVGAAKAKLGPGSIIYAPAGAWHAVH